MLRFIDKFVEPITGAVIIIIALYILLWPLKPIGIGMENTINDGDWILSSRFAANFFEPKKGDIVSFTDKDAGKTLIKRVIAVGGDEIEISEGIVFVNGEELSEAYAIGTTTGTLKTEIAEGYIYALSDNRTAANDSRIYGQIPIKNIKSKILFRFLPLSKITAFF